MINYEKEIFIVLNAELVIYRTSKSTQKHELNQFFVPTF